MSKVATITTITLAVLIGAALVGQRMSDGPIGPIPGGPLREGPLVTDRDVDWTFADGKPMELQLVEPPRSRIVGALVHDGQLFAMCDLGFIWARFTGIGNLRGRVIYSFKRWHEDASRDGRVVLRIQGKRYERQAVRVTDPDLLAALRGRVEAIIRFAVRPNPPPAAPTEGPREIWFFRMEPRPAA